MMKTMKFVFFHVAPALQVKRPTLVTLFFFIIFGVQSQDIDKQDFQSKRLVDLNINSLSISLKKAPMQKSAAAKESPYEINIPMPDGDERAFRVVESPIMASEFAAEYPNFSTYAIQAQDDPSVTGRISITPHGFDGIILTSHGMVLIRPLDLLHPVAHEVSLSHYTSSTFECETSHEPNVSDPVKLNKSLAFSNGGTKRTYTLAIVATGEFFEANGGTISSASSVIVASVNRIQAIYERELAVNFSLLTPFLYTDKATDPFVSSASRAFQAAEAVNANFPGGNYDLGHVFHNSGVIPSVFGGGGQAGLAVVCSSTAYGTGFRKGAGWSSHFDNYSYYWIDIAAHEFGHMFGMSHTFNGTGKSCTTNIEPTSSYEIGSGNSIMSYKNDCGLGQNTPVGCSADHYFHVESLEQAVSFINSQTCHTASSTGNTPPVVNANPCGGSITIPISTPFYLTGSGTDGNGDPIYYSWEQVDEDGTGTPTQGFTGATAGASTIAPLFRSYPPTNSPTRYFPNMKLVAANSYSSSFEPLPSVARTLNFKLTGRDWKLGGGGIHTSPLAVTVSASGPFTVSSPNGGENLAAGANTTVSWNVNGTNAFCTNVNIRLSTDGGLTFPYTLISGTPNDGSEMVTIPADLTNTTSARIMVERADNSCVVFFDISNVNFTITSTCNVAYSSICPSSSMILPAGDPGLNLMLTAQFGGLFKQNTFNISNASPLGPLGVATMQGGSICQAVSLYYHDFLDFTVETTGSYTFFNPNPNPAGGGPVIFSIFEALAYNPANPCASVFLGSNSSYDQGANYINWFSKLTVTLNQCTVYKMVVWSFDHSSMSPTIMTGPGNAFVYGSAPGANYSYTYAAVNSANNQIVAVHSSANFSGLVAGNYRIYGASYYSGAGPSPATVNPAGWSGQTMAQVTAGGSCVLFSLNYKELTVTSAPCVPATVSAPAITQPGCPVLTGSIIVNASGSGTLEYSVDNGSNWQTSNSFSALAAGNYNIKVRYQGNPTCISSYTSNPVSIISAGDPCTCNNYCAAGQSSGSCVGPDEFISHVSFNTLSNSSTCEQSLPGGYTSYVNMSTSVTKGYFYTLNVTNGSASENDQCKAWFDWNGDGDFVDAGEEFTLIGSGTNNTQNWTVNVSIPYGSITGSIRMRVRIDFNAAPTPCGTVDYGETEDYCISVMEACSIAINSVGYSSPACNQPFGSISVNACGNGALEYSANNGVSWQGYSEFCGLDPGIYYIKVRQKDNPGIVETYAANPILIRVLPDSPVIDSLTITQPSCTVVTGSIVVHATGDGALALEYSVDNGANWQASNSFIGLAPGSYPIYVRLKDYASCQGSSIGNPVALVAATGCCPADLVLDNVPIPNGSYQASSTISSMGLVPNTGSVVFRAAGGVMLNANFEVQSGGIFEIQILGCNL